MQLRDVGHHSAGTAVRVAGYGSIHEEDGGQRAVGREQRAWPDLVGDFQHVGAGLNAGRGRAVHIAGGYGQRI